MLSAEERWSIGVVMALSNCALSSAGFTLQRKSHLLSQQEQAKDEVIGVVPFRYRLMWTVGVLLYIAAAVPDVVAYAMAPQVVCTTVACFRLVVMTMLAHFFLNEHVQKREVLSMIICTVGTFLCLVFGPRPTEDNRMADAGDLYHPQVYSYLLIVLGLLICLLFLEHSESLGCPSLPDRLHYFILPVTTGLAFGVEKVFNTEIGFIPPPKDLPWGLLSQPQWPAMAAAIAALGLTDFYLNLRGVQKMPIQVFIPVAFAFATSLQYFQSVFIFGELREMSERDAALATLGAIASLVGALGIQPPHFQASTEYNLVSREQDPGAITHNAALV